MAANIAKIDVSLAARQYVGQGWVLVPIDQGTKGPSTKGWNTLQRCITQPDQCTRAKANVGLAHAYSRTCAVDVDHQDTASVWFAQRGVDLAALLTAPDAVRISSGRPNRAKLLYRLPDGLAPLPSKALHDEGFELRCATADGLSVQDVLPPSIHPDTGEAYTWAYGDPLVGDWRDLPTLPPELLTIWQELVKPRENLEVSDRAPLGMGTRALLDCLDAVPADELPYEASKGPSWLGMGMAVHHETRGEGFEIWDEWSRKSPKYSTREYGLQKWDSFGKRPHTAIVTARTLIAWARGEGADLPSADEFEDLTQTPGGEVKAAKFHVQGAGSFSSGPPLKWLVKGILPKAQLAMIYGESGAGKTFAVTDLVLAIVRGTEWRGHRVNKGRAVYVCGEGLSGFRNRLQAFAQHHEVDLSEIDESFGVVADVPNFLAHDDKALAVQINAWGGADAIVIDTLAQVTPGGNENSGEDMGKALAHCRRLHQATGALVVLIHHSGKDASKGARGWSGLKGATDVEIEVLRDGDQRSVRVSKMKDGATEGQEMGFSLHTVTLGLDEDGDEITSCVVEHGQVVPKHQRKAEPKGNVQKLVLRVLHDLVGLSDDAVMVTELIDAAVNQMPHDEGKRDTRRQHVLRAIETLTAGNAVRVADGKVGAC